MIREFGGKKPRIHPTAFVSEAAYVVGDVEIGAHSSIWPGTVIRGDQHTIVIGAYVNIQDNSVLHADEDTHYGDHVTIAHGVVCHARFVGAHTLIGNGAIVNNGASIGDHTLVAGGSVVRDRAEIPSHSFVVGAPAEVRGPALERHLRMIDRTAESYAVTGRRFREAGLGDVPAEFLTE